MGNIVLDYGEFATSFDQRYRVRSYAGIRTAVLQLVRGREARRVLEVGCGTGHWLRELDLPETFTVGLDKSRAMVREARKNAGRARLVCGAAASLPFAEQEFDLTCCINAFHHFTQPERFLLEASRVLKAGGVLAIIGLDPHKPDTNWYLYDYFEGVREWDHTRYPSAEQLAALVKRAAFDEVTSAVVETISHTWRGDEVWNDAFLRKESTSQLMGLSSEAYAAGLERMKRVIADSTGEGTPTFRVELRLVMTTGVRSRGVTYPGC